MSETKFDLVRKIIYLEYLTGGKSPLNQNRVSISIKHLHDGTFHQCKQNFFKTCIGLIISAHRILETSLAVPCVAHKLVYNSLNGETIFHVFFFKSKYVEIKP